MRDLNSGRTNVMRDSSTYTKWWSTGEKCGSSSLNTSVIKRHVSHCFYGCYVCYSSSRHWFNSRVAAGSHVQNYCMTIYRKRGLHVTFLPHRLTFWYFTSVYTDTLIQPTAPSVSCILIGVMFEVTQSEYVICQLIFLPSRLWIKPFNYWCADVSNPFECCMWCRPLSPSWFFPFPPLPFSPTPRHGNRMLERYGEGENTHNENYKWITKAIPRIRKKIGKTERSRRRDEERAESEDENERASH